MTSFCTSCGAAVGAGTSFCTACGAVRESGARSKRRRTWPWWVLAVIGFFLLGLWLGRGPAAKKPICGAASVQGGPGKLIQGPGQPTKVGRGGPGDSPDFSGSGGNVKVPPGSGLDGPGAGGDGDNAGAGGGGKAPTADDGDPASGPNGDGTQLKNDLRKFAEGKGNTDLRDIQDADAKATPKGKSYSANDFTYDKTNLPRYPDAVTAVVSSISYEPDGRTDTYSTGAGIVTSSSFDVVVAWYRQNLPPGWHDMTIGDMQQLSKQLSPQSIMQMLGAQAQGDPAAASSAAAVPTPAADQVRVSVFSPPAGSKAKSGVMIVQHGESPVEALLQAKVAP